KDDIVHQPWSQLLEEAAQVRKGKGYLNVELPGARVRFRPIAASLQHLDLDPIHAKGLTAKQIDARIVAAVRGASPAIDGQIVRLLVWDIARATAHDLDHEAIRGYKARALHFQLDLRRPEAAYQVGIGAPGRRQTLAETVRDF